MHSLNLIKVFDKLKQNDIFTDLALSWIEDNKDDPIFQWLQLLYPHAPYEPPSNFSKNLKFHMLELQMGHWNKFLL